MCPVLQFQRSRRERRYADHIFIHSDILQNAPFRSQIFKFLLRQQGGIDPPKPKSCADGHAYRCFETLLIGRTGKTPLCR